MTVKFSVSLPLTQAIFDAVGERVLSAVRPAAQAMAQVYYEALLRSYDAAGIDTKTGNLKGAIYQAYRKEVSTESMSAYAVSWAGNAKKSGKASQHAHLIEYGHWMRYAIVKNKRGEWVTAVRPEMRGRPKPKRTDPLSVKDAYFVLRPGGPKFVAPRPFMRPVRYSEAIKAQAVEAARVKFNEAIR